MAQINSMSSRIPGIAGFWKFVRTRYPLPKHVIYTIIWYTALFGSLLVMRPFHGAWQFKSAILSIGTIVMLFFFMRAVDEIKDLDYDKKHNPDRALVRGIVTTGDVTGYLIGTALIVVGLNAFYSLSMALMTIFIMLLSIGLLGLEYLSPRFESSMFLNTMVSIQLKTGTGFYVYLGYLTESGHRPQWTDVALIIGLILAYLHWEVARKIVRPEFARSGEKLYSREAGLLGSIGIALGLLLSACALMLVFFQPWNADDARSLLAWFPCLALVPSCYGTVRFLLKSNERDTMTLFSLVGYLTFLFALIGQSLLLLRG